MNRPFLVYPDRRLRQVAEPVALIDDDVRALWDEMLAAMYAMPGVGLAAPQLGVGRRLIVVDASEGRDRPLRMANPRITATGQATRRHLEGSPNLPGQWAEVERPEPVTVAWTGADGAAAEETFTGLWATSVQHQIDHLDGRLFIDRLSPVRRRMLIERHRKQQRKNRRGAR